ncbi:carboxymuconolactone decarboxylase [Burkholderia ubonensis]|uniref:Carboxymuconolactone decarboxylase n=1 Tax=Burkholderia ubonensis TaxID=101571 RepID=A0A102LK94_9BURK|nr:carboxymuconolactone decarboxylase family protein [Burkholderia ubonensis]KUZ72461.1 carboxymuconolactone decarboxylase [Burkholderia ubonensis]KUZ90405.1 carboxymuconolactone decarboxylase [Burkholderia ubonensis]KUZ95106.1 carboxymuconolactone decarboxylase [Burkholderia ubonensis]
MSVIQAIGNGGFTSLSAALDSLDPDFKRLLVEGAYADIIARPNLSLKHRELVTVAVLATTGNADSALKYHAGGMLNTGWTPEALLETVWQTLFHAGVPVAMTGVRHAAAVLRERGVAVGREADLLGQYEAAVTYMLERRPQPFNALTLKERALATLAIVMALENQHDAVRQHLKACLRLGWTRGELTEVLIQLTGYVGWPLVLPMSRIALDVFDATPDEPGAEPKSTVAAQNALAFDPCAPGASACIADTAAELARHLGESDASTSRVDSVDRAKARHLTAIACLTCLARNADVEALGAHMREVLLLGASHHEIVDVIIGAMPLAGVLAVQSALCAANRLFASTGQHAAPEQENALA